MSTSNGASATGHQRPILGSFSIDRKMLRLWKLIGVCCTLLFASFLVLSLATFDTETESIGTILFVYGGFGFFTLLGAYICHFAFVEAPRRRVCFNNEGIWLAAYPEAPHFVRWEEIRTLRERPLLQRLEVFDAREVRRINIDHQIEDFDTFRMEFMDRSLPFRRRLPIPVTIAARRKPFILYALTIVVVSYIWIREGEFTLQGDWYYFLFMGGLIFGILVTPFQLQIDSEYLRVRRLLNGRTVQRRNIDYLELQNNLIQGARHLSVIVHERGIRRKTLLTGFEVSTLELHEALYDWVEEDSRAYPESGERN